MADNDNVKAQMEILATLLVLDDEIRKLNSIREFGFFITNETHRLIPYETAYLWKYHGIHSINITAQSGVAEVDQHALINLTLKRLITYYNHQHPENTLLQVNLAKVEQDSPDLGLKYADIEMHFPQFFLSYPLKNKSNERTGGLILFRDTEFTDSEIKTLNWLIASYEYTWQMLSHSKKIFHFKNFKKQPLIPIVIILVIGMLLFPIRISVLGTGMVIPKNPILINAPLQGVIRTFAVSPGETVKKGQLLLTLDKTDLLAEAEVNKRDLLLTQARLRTAINQGFDKKDNIADIPILQAQLAIDESHLNYTNTLLNKTQITSPIDGIVVFDSKEDWIGQPVQTGERILLIADQRQLELKIYLPITNSIALEKGDEGDFYPYGQLFSLSFKLKSLGYNAKLTPNKILSYELTAEFDEIEHLPQLGSQGTVRIYSERVPLIYFLLRRPLQAFRQTFGI